MKRIIVATLAALAIAGAVSAQSPAPAAQAQTTAISGKLELIDGMIGLKADGTSYYVPRLRQLVGFVKELQEGASVKLEGYAYPIPNRAGYSYFMATKLTIGAKDYDLGQPGARGPFGGQGQGQGRGGMRGGRMGGMGGGGPRW